MAHYTTDGGEKSQIIFENFDVLAQSAGLNQPTT
jgi:hypothetical protein